MDVKLNLTVRHIQVGLLLCKFTVPANMAPAIRKMHRTQHVTTPPAPNPADLRSDVVRCSTSVSRRLHAHCDSAIARIYKIELSDRHKKSNGIILAVATDNKIKEKQQNYLAQETCLQTVLRPTNQKIYSRNSVKSFPSLRRNITEKSKFAPLPILHPCPKDLLSISLHL